MKERKIIFGRWEATSVLVTMISAKSVLTFPRVMAEKGGSAGWILVLYISLITLLLFMLIVRLYSPYESKDLIDISETTAGTVGRLITGLILVAFLGGLTSTGIREFSEQMKILALATTPISFIMLFFTAGLIAGSYLGIESIVRFQSILVPVIIVSYVSYLLMLVPYMDFSLLTPLLGLGPKPLFVDSIPKISDFGELVFLFLFIPFIKTQEKFKKVGYAAIGLNAFFLISVTIAYLATFPFPVAMEFQIPVYTMGLMINYGRLLQRVEAIFLTTWSFIGLMYICTAFYFTIYTFKKTFNLQYTRPLILPFACLVYTTALLPGNLMTSLEFKVVFIRNWAWVVAFVVPILLLVLARFMRSKNKKTG